MSVVDHTEFGQQQFVGSSAVWLFVPSPHAPLHGQNFSCTCACWTTHTHTHTHSHSRTHAHALSNGSASSKCASNAQDDSLASSFCFLSGKAYYTRTRSDTGGTSRANTAFTLRLTFTTKAQLFLDPKKGVKGDVVVHLGTSRGNLELLEASG